MGELADDEEPHGIGTIIYANGRIYEGEWRDGKRNGKEITKRADGSVMYDGYHKDDHKHGKP